jgi:hypothetical protein
MRNFVKHSDTKDWRYVSWFNWTIETAPAPQKYSVLDACATGTFYILRRTEALLEYDARVRRFPVAPRVIKKINFLNNSEMWGCDQVTKFLIVCIMFV